MKWRKSISFLILIYSGTLVAQNSPEKVYHSSLMEIDLPSEATLDHRIFYIAVAKTTLELEATNQQVKISDVEVLTFSNLSGDKQDSWKWVEGVKKSLSDSRYRIYPSRMDPSYSWLTKDGSNYLMYSSIGKKEATVYFGVADQLPNSISQSLKENDPSDAAPKVRQDDIISKNNPIEAGENIPSGLVGEWGNVVGAKVNWSDESTGYMVVSGVSKGYGLELNADGTFRYSMVVTSGRPNYRVFVSTTGTWSLLENQIIFTPNDRHYRKWENEIIMVNEHSVPDPYSIFWTLGSNSITGKECLYIKYDLQQEKWDELCKE
jgi:hypothetical protein